MMTNISTNGSAKKICAFCRSWYDPTNSCIRPVYPKMGMWEFERTMKSLCTKSNGQRFAWQTCPKFEYKL